MTLPYKSLLINSPTLEQLNSVTPLPALSNVTLNFIDELSRKLMLSQDARSFPELIALAYWMRKSNLEHLRDGMFHHIGNTVLTPRGTVLHIAPSNVDTIFVYSWFLSMLTGNRNIVRLSSKSSAQSNILVRIISDLLAMPCYSAIVQRTLLIQYSPDDYITELLSSVCDVRVIWGGDSTVQNIRRLYLPPTSVEVAFPNKYSLALLHSERWQNANEAEKNDLARAFYNDAYWFDQMACSSPRLVLWIGSRDQGQVASADFWPRIEAILASRNQRFSDIDYVNKLIAQDSMAMEFDVHIVAGKSNDLVRIWLDKPALHVEHHCGAGIFFECSLPNLYAIRPILSRTVQTVSYAGFTKEELNAFVTEAPISGIDRIVPFGRALDFGPIWDGFDLIRVFMREITIT
jgi:hypothetical protein